MQYQVYAHRYADIILNSDYELKKEIEDVTRTISFSDVQKEYDLQNTERKIAGKKEHQGRQAIINTHFRKHFVDRGWLSEKYVFGDSTTTDQDLKLDFYKRKVGVDVAFNHRSFIGGDLLRLQAAAEVSNIISVGVYICPTKSFARIISPKDGNSMVSFERADWYLKNFYPVLTVPILLIGLSC